MKDEDPIYLLPAPSPAACRLSILHSLDQPADQELSSKLWIVFVISDGKKGGAVLYIST